MLLCNMFFSVQMLVPRVSYFPLIYDKLERLYARAADYNPGNHDEIWLSNEDIPLKWCVNYDKNFCGGIYRDLKGRGEGGRMAVVYRS